jgi:hypothetical protein
MLISLGIGVGAAMYSLNHDDPMTTILAFCKMRIYFLQSTSMMYRWLFTIACFDRYALSSASVRLRNFAKVYIARRVVAMIICVWLVLPIHGPIFYELRVGGCGIFGNQVAALYHSIFTTTLGCIFPVIIMMICAILVYRNLLLKQQRLQHNINSQHTENRNEVERGQRIRDQQVFLMLLIQVFVYVVSVTPLMMMYLYNAATLSNSNKSADRINLENFLFFAAEVIVYFFPVSSFYLYTLASNLFRKELKRLLYLPFTCNWNNTRRIEPTTNPVQLRTVVTHQVT